MDILFNIIIKQKRLSHKSENRAGDLLINFAIGQYDTYTPIQLSQYISTVANGGNRMKPYLLKSVYKPTKTKLTDLVYSTEPIILNKVNIEEKYLNRIKKGLRMVFEPGGTASGHINNKYEPAGKTGTSESFVDTDGDGIIDKETLSTVLVAYAPYDDPVVSFTVVTPNVATGDVSYGQMSKVNTRISKKISQKYFEIYK
jgi:cell division protein FtsI/penicillin-binding protein 2